MKNIIKILTIVISSIILICSLGFVFAEQYEQEQELEIVYPNINEEYTVPPNSPFTRVSDLIQYIYVFAVAGAGLVSFLCVLLGGIRYLTSVGNPATMQDARNQIFSGLLGMLIIFGSYVILRTISPDFISFSLPQVPVNTRGVIFYSDNECGAGANGDPYSIDLKGKGIEYLRLSDTRSNLGARKEGNPGIFTIKSFYSYYSREDLDITFYIDKNCEGAPISIPPEDKLQGPNDPGFILTPGCCNSIHGCSGVGLSNPSGIVSADSLEIQGVQCIKFVWKNPGVWLFDYVNGNPLHPRGEAGVNYVNYQMSNNIEISDKIKSLALLKNAKDGIYYGAILHNYPVGKGGNRDWAEVFLPNFGNDITVYNLAEENGIALDASSVTVFKIPFESTASTKDIFTLYREVSRDSIFDKTTKKLITPQREIGWNTIPHFEDLINIVCQGHDGYSAYTAKISTAISSDPPSAWNSLVSCSGDGNTAPSKVIGGINIIEDHLMWLREDGTTADIDDGEIVLTEDGGVSGIFFPSNDRYLALLYGENTSKDKISRDNPKDLVLNGASVESQAALLYNHNSALSSISFDKQLKTLIVIRLAD